LHLQRVHEARQQAEETRRRIAAFQAQPEVAHEATVVTSTTGINGEPLRTITVPSKPPAVRHPSEKPHGPMQIARGVIQGVTCSSPAVIDVQVKSATKKLALYNNNWYDIDFSAGNFTPKGELHPCDELGGMKVKVTYFATADKSVDGQIVSIMMFR
ncbi:MAG TPA: hypothetical protein VGS02_01660, partial [Acidobacteriaceae bacterium]|nr:hypothetical protein [Acidobacteriaceae bacterium]